MYDSETHQQTRRRTHVLVRQDLLQHLQGVYETIFSVLVCLSCSNCRAVWVFLEAKGDILRNTDIGKQTGFPVYITAAWTRQTTTY